MAISTLVRVQRAFACTADTIYDAWLEPSVARRFLFATPPAGEVVRCDIEPGVGGKFVITDRRPLDGEPAQSVDVEHVGRFLQLDRPRRIAFAFAVPAFGGPETTVVIDIEPQGDGCGLTLRHDLGPAEDAKDMLESVEQGWVKILANLEGALKG
jgi:uncharacterized protein YndB with AHSA1/START domain